MAYTVSGPTENVFASLVVLLGYTHTFTRTAQWQNNARYEVGDGLVCGFRQEAERDGELDFVLCFGPEGRPAGADALPGIVRELPGAAKPDGDALRTGRCSKADIRSIAPVVASQRRRRARFRFLQRNAARS